ncbi:hypothetical protein [uncultured Amphritea sp.]|uniref:hypothetical protein n=1 Tax=uncultured Amphritea sp. TaxID=981605 RepID=UPI0025EE4F29|nr:hypothetical protein [uncultured Amphritea sp.]
MSKYSRHTKYALVKFLLIAVPCVTIIVLWVYGKIVWKGWPVMGALIAGLGMFMRDRSAIIAVYTDEEEKYIEVAEDHLKMVEPSKKYEGFIRFNDVDIAELSISDGQITRILFRMKNHQKIVVTGYDGLEHAAEVVRNSRDINVVET